MFAISADNLSAGIATAAFVAYLSGLTNVAYSATQYALFSSVMLLLPKFIAGFPARSSTRMATSRSSIDCRAGHPGAAAGLARQPGRGPADCAGAFSGLAVPVVEIGVGAMHAPAVKQGPLVRENARYLPESGYSQTSGISCVLIDRYFSGAVEVLMIWCGYSGPGRDVDDVAGANRDHSPATRSVPSPSRITNISSCA